MCCPDRNAVDGAVVGIGGGGAAASAAGGGDDLFLPALVEISVQAVELVPEAAEVGSSR